MSFIPEVVGWHSQCSPQVHNLTSLFNQKYAHQKSGSGVLAAATASSSQCHVVGLKPGLKSDSCKMQFRWIMEERIPKRRDIEMLWRIYHV